MARTHSPMMALGALILAFAWPASAMAQSIKFTKLSPWKSAHAMAGCWEAGATNFSDDGLGLYPWQRVITGTVSARVIAQAAAGNPATLVFSEGGTVVTADAADGAERLVGAPIVTVSADGGAPVAVPITNTAVNGPNCATRFGATGCSRVTTFTAAVDAATLAAAGAVCGSELVFDIILEGDAYASCNQGVDGHADAVWRGQGTYPNIKPRLFYDGTQAPCAP